MACVALYFCFQMEPSGQKPRSFLNPCRGGKLIVPAPLPSILYEKTEPGGIVHGNFFPGLVHCSASHIACRPSSLHFSLSPPQPLFLFPSITTVSSSLQTQREKDKK